jgi:toxin ParE1/3/4
MRYGERALVRLSALAEGDIIAILARTEETFGKPARFRYEALLENCLRDIAIDPLCLGSAARPEIGEGIRTYHLRHGRSRGRVISGSTPMAFRPAPKCTCS